MPNRRVQYVDIICDNGYAEYTLLINGYFHSVVYRFDING